MNTRTIMVSAREVTNGKTKFINCSAKLNNVWFKIKFTRACNDRPLEKGRYDISVNLDECSTQNGGTYTDKYGIVKEGAPIIWINKIESIRKYTDEELKEESRRRISEIFDGVDF